MNLPADTRGSFVVRTAACAVLAVATAAPRALWADGASMRLLESHGIEPTTESIRVFLQSLAPGEEQSARQKELVELLGAADYFRREQATAQLLNLPRVSRGLLQAVVEGADAEAAWRARQLLMRLDRREAARQDEQVLSAVFQVIAERRLPGLCGPLADVLPQCQDSGQLRLARRALESTATASDAGFLRTLLREGPAEVRIVALEVLSGIPDVDVVPDLKPLLSDDEDRVAMAAAWILADRGHRSTLSPLASLLESEHLDVRVASAHVLREVTGRHFGYLPFDTLSRRQQAARDWQQWIAAEGADSEFRFPLRMREPLIGRTLVCFREGNRIVELDHAGRIAWQTEIATPCGCQGLPNGHRLVASYAGRRLVEFDEAGREVWSSPALQGRPFGARRLDDEHTLAACTSSRLVLEFDPRGRVVWQARLPGEPTDARRLENGRTLVALQASDQVVEVDAHGQVVWAVGNMFTPRSAQRLKNGNTLVAQARGGKVVEVNPHGRVVWSRAGLLGPMDAQRLSNGNTLIAEQRGVVEVDAEGKVVWIRQAHDVSAVCRY